MSENNTLSSDSVSNIEVEHYLDDFFAQIDSIPMIGHICTNRDI